MISRRNFLKLSGIGLAGATLAGCGVSEIDMNALVPPAALNAFPAADPPADWRVLNRITFGPTAAERASAAKIGPDGFIETQLAPDSIEEDWRAEWRIRRIESLHQPAANLYIRSPEKQEGLRLDLQRGTTLRAVYSRRQLYEVMVNFWSDHFNIDQTKGDCTFLKIVDDREVIRRHALGNFRDLLFASAHSPAMLVYLDNQENRAGIPNENYAREVMELHTLGVGGGYTQNDVMALARCLTGWTVKDHFYRGEFTFNADMHDDGAKTVLGIPIPAGLGQAGAENVLDALAAHPSTAKFIAAKLVRRFVADDPPAALVARTTDTFLKTGGDIKAMLKTILFSPEFRQPDPTRRKLKRPFNFVVSALRQLNADTDGGAPVQSVLRQMGQPLFQFPTPDGYPDTATAWEGTLLTRWRFAFALAHNQLSHTRLSLADMADLAENAPTPIEKFAPSSRGFQLQQFAILLFGQPLPAPLAETLVAEVSPDEPHALLAALIGAPAFQWK